MFRCEITAPPKSNTIDSVAWFFVEQTAGKDKISRLRRGRVMDLRCKDPTLFSSMLLQPDARLSLFICDKQDRICRKTRHDLVASNEEVFRPIFKKRK
uniref:Uncharacterized protein n=1 Tax=Magallana gigas TaxID=29159 RepID=K1PAR2_MAGGI